MKNKVLKSRLIALAIVLGVSFTLQSCKKDNVSDKEAQQVEKITDATLFDVDKELSNIDWKGYKIFKSEKTSHFGTLKFSEGEIGVKDNQIVSGKFVADMHSLANTDLADNKEASEKLDGHLKSVDFFNVEKYPTATFEITKITPKTEGDYNSTVEGNLTIKETTKSVSFNANLSIDGEQISLSTEPTDIDRTLFGVEFQSPIENGVIKNEMTLQINLKAKLRK
ncbi:MAG: YceI family protein [Flavobacteriaceae bacterium]|nr:YceI family protein [Flavobacteriaceae bacterium]